MLTLLTTTGCRPQAWGLCEAMMAAQDVEGPVRWVIVDDGPEAQPIAFRRDGWEVEVIRRRPYWSPGQNTQAANLAAGLREIGDDERVAVIEDDDGYLAGYLSAVSAWLDRAELVGESHARYYHVGRRVWRLCGNTDHASLCSTGVRGEALRLLRELVTENAKFIDIALWRGFAGRRLLQHTQHVVGIKGLPGRGGIGAGHRMDGSRDPQLNTLHQWMGSLAQHYEAFGQ